MLISDSFQFSVLSHSSQGAGFASDVFRMESSVRYLLSSKWETDTVGYKPVNIQCQIIPSKVDRDYNKVNMVDRVTPTLCC